MAKGRPTKLTPGIADAIVAAIREGCPYEVAAQTTGVSQTSIYAWKARGERESTGPYADFLKAIKRAEADAELEAIERVRGIGFGGVVIGRRIVTQRNGDVIEDVTYSHPQWQAFAWYLERKYPDRWGRRDRVDVTVRKEAERIAGEFGVDVDEIITRAQSIANGKA